MDGIKTVEMARSSFSECELGDVFYCKLANTLKMMGRNGETMIARAIENLHVDRSNDSYTCYIIGRDDTAEDDECFICRHKVESENKIRHGKPTGNDKEVEGGCKGLNWLCRTCYEEIPERCPYCMGSWNDGVAFVW